MTAADDAPTDLVHLRASGVSVVVDLAGALPRILHWGSDLGALDATGLAAVRRAWVPVPHGYPVDGGVEIAVLPQESTGYLGTPGLVGSRGGQDFSTLFVTGSHGVETTPEGTQRLTVDAGDDAARLTLRLVLELTAEGLLRQQATLTNRADEVYGLDGLLLTFPVPRVATELLDFSGRWARERSPQRTQFTHGTRLRENRRGRTGYDTAYVLVAGTAGFANRTGEVWGLHTAWSGNHRMLAERSHYNPGLLGGGELLGSGEVRLGGGESYASPWVYGSWGTGLDELAGRFHAWMRARPQHPATPRPVTLNTWEAVYFQHDLDRLTALADAAAAVGAERFVLDDGWFGDRRDDTRALGDWHVSADVWPDGLHPLVEHVTGLGMQFGLWVEPEMVNPDSDLARAHPDWILQVPSRLPRAARHQQVLDLAVPGAYAYILERMDALLTEYPIGYLKWDHNRDLVDAGHGGLPGVHGQTLAIYRLLDELRALHPGVEIESCSSGGARVDLEILQRTDRVWASDCIDAFERQQIQRWTNLLIPLELIGAHIGSGHAHSTGRRHELSFRAGTALFGHLGIEWDLQEAGEAERADLAAWIALYKEVRPLLHTGTSVHADVVDPVLAVHGVVGADRQDALYALAMTGRSTDTALPRLTLPGLDPDASYLVRPQAPGDAVDHAPQWWTPEGVQLPGRVLSAVGLEAPLQLPERIALVRATRV
ncbi:alpha-galactosidase [Cellulomonas fengjieae]|uniref:alpha-galactosidase n=1 Tax=Cellulomonas fengjieae TaxID=2819978 RepID=A0ABS3SGP7_9CELL|nr:alpha-galactosidase [Cellulomonas fengjieae]MBO3084908.1 alpha-galactosidase [Cellulomonas fengjieae]QVI66781.1 alpha-galactosidase [Cellulomonas fengjieae]